MKMASTLQLFKLYLFCCMNWIKCVTDYMRSLGKVLHKPDTYDNCVHHSYKVYVLSCLFHYCYYTNLPGLVGKVQLYPGKVITF